MSNPNYEPPKTNPENPDFIQERTPLSNHWSLGKLMILTFLPFGLCVFSLFILMAGSGRMSDIDFFFVAIPIVAGVIAICTAAHFAMRDKNGNALRFIAYLIVWGGAHFGLLFIGMFACAFIANPSFH